MTAAGLIFSNIHDKYIPEMTSRRTMASLPFGGRYRLVDFALSNMVNSGISKVGIVTHNNYRSLIDHIGTGKDWDLARRSGGIIILPPFITAFDNPRANQLYTTRLEALMGVMEFISHCDEDLIVLSDCDTVCNIDLSDVIEQHEQSGADLTVVTKRMFLDSNTDEGAKTIVMSDSDGRITDFVEYTRIMNGEYDVNTNIMVFTRTFLISVLNSAIAYGYNDLYHQALPFAIANSKYCTYSYNGYYSTIAGLDKYFSANMELLESGVRAQLFGNKERPVYTKVRNTPPTKYAEGASVKNSLIADGCVIEGTVENSILFRGVHVKKGCVIKNSIMLQNTSAGEDVSLNCVITDKNVVIRDGKTLAGSDNLPFYIAKGKMI
ncbi:MAG: glucose-1-phosphate adenylyltransferase subunit GlgD [Ruminococcaceae bacterium]|nr:glucose-1-phosphate adenylyltransferase subunit GlgD [Oscillospiraceae bacterium]